MARSRWRITLLRNFGRIWKEQANYYSRTNFEVDSSRVLRVSISVQSLGSSVCKSHFAFSAFTGVFFYHCSKAEIDNNNLQQTNDQYTVRHQIQHTNDKYTVRHQMVAVNDDVCRMRLSGQTAAMTTTTTTMTTTTTTTMTTTTMRTENP